MILVDIYVPILDKSFDFNLNEDAPVSAIIDEVSEMISQKERWPNPKNSQSLTLSFPERNCILAPEKNLRQAGVDTGSRLVLT
jgi:hypothetical protein